MNIKNAFVTAIRSLKRNKLRSFLTSIGIIIGVSSVILMIGLGSSARIEVKDKISNFGENGIAIEIKPGARYFKISDYNYIKQNLYEIDGITPVCYRSVKYNYVRYRNNIFNTILWGVNNDFLKIKGRSVINGRAFTEEEIVSYGKVAIIGLTLKEELFGNANPIGEYILFNDIPLQIVGVLNRAGKAFSGKDFDNKLLIPYSTANIRIFGQRDTYAEILMSTKEEYMLESAEKNIVNYLRRVRNLKSDQDNDFFINTSKQKLKMTEDITRALSYLLAGIASISLLVGGVGIMNIMLVSVTERTREIGIRMAIGAKRKDILFQFLIEAITLTSAGGFLGIIIGLAGYLIIIHFLNWVFVFSVFSVFLSFLFSGAVGIFFGYYPAKKASNLKPIEALKFE